MKNSNPPVFDTIKNKVSTLDSLPGIMYLFEKLKDDTLMDPLVEKMVKPETVFKIEGNQVKRVKRNIQSPEVIFM